MRHSSHEDSRRDFIRGSSLLLAGAVPAALAHASSQPADHRSADQSSLLRIGLVGCGNRGTAAAVQAITAADSMGRLVAVADLFEDRLQQATRALKGKFPEQYAVDRDHRFVGLNAYQDLLATEVDLVILATAPVFRPIHTAAAIQAGKHVFAEKPIAVDAPGVRSFFQSCEEARRRGLIVAVGFQRRHMTSYAETIERLRQGAIGQLTSGLAECNRPHPVVQPQRRGQSELEFQLRNWRLFEWAGGGSIVEEQVQSLDAINWLIDDHPIEAHPCNDFTNVPMLSTRAKQDTTSAKQEIVEFTYRNGFRLRSVTQSIGRQYESSEWVYGTHGSCDLSHGKIFDDKQRLIWKSDASRDGYQVEIERLVANVKRPTSDFVREHDQDCSEGRYAAESTLTAIMGRMALSHRERVRWGDCFSSDECYSSV